MKIRKYLSVLLAMILLTGMFGGSSTVVSASAASADEITVTVDGAAYEGSLAILDGGVFAPFEEVFEALGAESVWFEEEEAVAAQKEDALIVMLPGLNYFIKEVDGDGGVIYSMNAAPVIEDGEVLVPVKAAAEAFDYQVVWDEDAQTMTISSGQWLTGSNAPTNAYIYNGVIYYSFIYEPYLYAYDGISTQTYAAGGAPLGIVARENDVYYINQENQCIYVIHTADGSREIVFSELSEISDFSISGNTMVVIGYDSEEVQLVYRVDLTDGAFDILYTWPDPDELIRESGSQFALWKEYLFVVEAISPLISDGVSTCKVLMIDTNTGESREAVHIEGTVARISMTRSRYTNRYGGVSVKFDDSSAWFAIRLTSSNSSGTRSESHYEYYRIELESGLAEAVTEDDYNNASDRTSQSLEEWVYDSNASEVYRTNTESDITETLLEGSNYYYIANDDRWVVVLRAESKGGTPIAAEGYEYAQLYVMDPDGNNLQMIQSYGASPSSSSGSGSSGALEAEACELCSGQGMVFCQYCGGTGRGQTITVLGMPTAQSCTYCGGSGQRLCNGCGGSGQK